MRLATAALTLGLAAARAHAEGPPLYYQDPDGKPLYAPGPKKTPDGRDYRPIFNDAAPIAPAPDHRVLYYRNPMGLPDTSPKPKKDSMGMDYVPVYADDAAAGDPPGMVRIAPGRLQTLGVRTETATMRPPEARAIEATGTLQFDERHLATITTKMPGWIESLAVSAAGDLVRKGETLAEIYSPDLVAAEGEFLVASRIGGELRAAALQRLRALDIPEPEIARLRRTGRASRDIAVLATEDGLVIDKPVQQGMRVDAGEPLYRTADMSELWLIAQVQEQDLGAIASGAVAHAVFVAFPGRVFDGTVDFIYPSLSADTRTARVRILLPNPDGALRAAMFASVRIEAASGGEPVLAIPNSAVLDNGARQFVLVAAGAGRFEPRQVRLGLRGDDRVQVLSGIRPGEQVVTGANFLIDAESNLRAALQDFTNAAKPAAAGAAP